VYPVERFFMDLAAILAMAATGYALYLPT